MARVCMEVPDVKLEKLRKMTVGSLFDEADEEILETPLYEEEEVTEADASD